MSEQIEKGVSPPTTGGLVVNSVLQSSSPKKRVYVRKPKVVDIPEPISEQIEKGVSPPTTGGLGVNSVLQSSSPKKRVYVRKPKVVDISEPISEQKCVTPPTTTGGLGVNSVLQSSSPNVNVEKTKKPRTEKQILAFTKMREAQQSRNLLKQSKQNELNELNLIEKENKSENKKLNRLTEKVLRKSNKISAHQKAVTERYYSTDEEEEIPSRTSSSPNIQETKVKQYIFV